VYSKKSNNFCLTHFLIGGFPSDLLPNTFKMLKNIVLTGSLLVTLSTQLAYVHPHVHGAHADSETLEAALPSTWYHTDNHKVHDLFRRDPSSTDGTTYATVGSTRTFSRSSPSSLIGPYSSPSFLTEWQSGWTWDLLPKEKLPSAWFDALDAAVAAGKIPNIAPPIQKKLPDGSLSNPIYADGSGGESPDICSQTAGCLGKGVIKDAPDGVFATSFDDGPIAVGLFFFS
jgi:chitin deacetylase